jgi:hypothetical protein
MAGPTKIEGVDGVVQTFLGAPPAQSVVDDEDARQLRQDITQGDAVWITGVRIDNSENPETMAYIKFYDDDTPDVGVTPPVMVLRAKPGTVTEFFVKAVVDYLSYIVHAEPGKGGTDSCPNPVRVTYGIFPK